MMSSWNDPSLRKLFQDQTPLIDVRAPVEFEEGSLPGSVNLSIMNNEERAQVGTCYKNFGQAAAIELGHQLVNGPVKDERIKAWTEFLGQNPRAQVYCLRGGLRSQISCQWLRALGHDLNPIEGGYKRMRNFFLSLLDESPLPGFVRIGGLTGSGKTRVLKKIKHHIDIEGLANHRGSAFGHNGPQPGQVLFENRMALGLLNASASPVWFEDESVTLGKLSIPARIFTGLRQSPLVVLKVEHSQRVQNIFEDYVRHSTPEFFYQGIERISSRLGGLRSAAIKEKIRASYQKPLSEAHHEEWITTLLKDYYDPFYLKAMTAQKDLIVFEGNEEEVLHFSQKMTN
ncbi:MAG TPA: tRNA 2-selenouridine(34) synthase MnmH [Bacteriovoracaceae bacterium]|nr:tRNA 2-selenouridine(34) synthase MnmH [Bacteriovoracaceae bacterium]